MYDSSHISILQSLERNIMIITIVRKCGCDADSIGRAVAEKYHLHFMDREAIAAGAKEAGCYE